MNTSNSAADAAPLAGGPATPDASVAPVAVKDRIESLDFIRGIAVMGILAANIIAFGQPFTAYMYPAAFIGETGDPDGWLWIAQFVLIDGKMRGLFTLLFGAGLYLFMERAWARGSTRWLQAWRLVLLATFGYLHFFFIWMGDILFAYGTIGLLAILFLRMSVKAQLGLGLGLYCLAGLAFTAALTMPHAIADTEFGQSEQFAETREEMIAEIDVAIADTQPVNEAKASGDYGAFLADRAQNRAAMPAMNLIFILFETFPLMLIGVALYRTGFFSGGHERGKLLWWGWGGFLVGGAMSLGIGLYVQATGFTYYSTLAAYVGWSYFPRFFMVLGMAALLVAYAPSGSGWLADRVRAAGRAAFTNYLGTSIVMLLVFHGWALGLFGELTRPQLYLVTLLTCALMLAWSKPWLDRFRYGPLEWLWRCLTYRRIFPLRR